MRAANGGERRRHFRLSIALGTAAAQASRAAVLSACILFDFSRGGEKIKHLFVAQLVPQRLSELLVLVQLAQARRLLVLLAHQLVDPRTDLVVRDFDPLRSGIDGIDGPLARE